MALFLKQSVAVTALLGPFVDNTDGFTAETGLTIAQADVRLSKNTGAFAQKSETTTCTHMENGYYSCLLNTTDTNTLGILRIAVNESGALPVWQDYMVMPANVYDSLFGADQLQVHVNEMTAGIITATVLATDTITAAKIAADAIGVSEFAAATIAAIADAVWDELASDHIISNTFGQRLRIGSQGTAQAGAAGTITLTSGASAVDNYFKGMLVIITGGTGAGQSRYIHTYTGSSKVAGISPNWGTNPDATSVYMVIAHGGAVETTLISTNGLNAASLATDAVTEIQTGLATQASVDVIDDFLDTEIAAIKAKTDNLPADPADASDIATAFTGVNTKLDTIDDFLDTEVAAIKAKTDNLPADPADASDIATSFSGVNTKLDTIDDFLDLEIAAIKAKTDNLPADPADASDIATAFAALPTAAQIADAVLDDPITQPGGVFAWGGATLRNIVGWMGALARNKMTQDSTETVLRNDADNADLASSPISESAGTFTRGEWV